LKCNRIAHARNWTVQRDLHHEKFRNSVLVFPLKVTAKKDEWQKLTYEPGGSCRRLFPRLRRAGGRLKSWGWLSFSLGNSRGNDCRAGAFSFL
jgi:hypothetical protein